jgi:hypothetical protein
MNPNQKNKDADVMASPPKPRIRFMRYIIGALIGGIAGFAYYKFIGCSTGTCPITSNPWSSTIYGMLMGTMVGSSIG